MRGCHTQNVFYIASARVGGSNRVRAGGQSHLSRGLTEFYYNLNFGIESMHMNRLVILRVSDKSNSVEP